MKQKFIQNWVKFLTLILGVLGFAACNHENGEDEYGPCLYGPNPMNYKAVILQVKGNIVNNVQQNIKSTVVVKVTEDGENYDTYATVKTNDFGFYQFDESFSEACLGLRFVVQDDKNYYLPDSVDVKLKFPEEDGVSYEKKEFNFTLTPRLKF
ncbi:MAG: hypothetical protein II956_00215 [Bacteroidales bacterium]|nr:hypothetical protein [Bacteroidales bacterium]